jgi:hypothetical protein
MGVVQMWRSGAHRRPTLADKKRPRRWGTPVMLLAWFMGSGFLYAQTTPVVAGPYSIAGRVVNATTGEPVRRATVAALGEDDGGIVQSTQTDAEGRFALNHLAAGKYPLSASRRGYRLGFYDEHEGGYNSAIVTGPDQDTTHLVFKLTPQAVIYGVVTGDGGDPVENANVTLFRHERGASGAIKEVGSATTDDTGTYEFTELDPGEYLIAVIASPWYAMHPVSGATPGNATDTDENPALDVAYPVTYFDSTTDEASASPITLEAGGRQEADIALHAVPALRLQVPAPRRGRDIVQPELRQTVFGQEVQGDMSGSGDPLHTGFVEFNGIAPGHYELKEGDPPRIVELNATSSQAVDADAGAVAATVTGILRSTGAPLPESVNLVLEPAAGSIHPSMMTVARNGEFRFDGVPAGNWALSADAQGTTLQVVAVSTGGAAIAGNQIPVTDRAVSVVAMVSRSLMRVQGFARAGGKGVAGAMIVLVPRQRTAYRALVRRDQSDSDGSFNLRDVPAGQYTVVAILDGWKLDWTEWATIAPYLPHGVPVTVSGQAGGVVRLNAPVPVQ